MASVARAIEQAASCTVDESLWWDSHESLFHFLDDYVSGFRKLPSDTVLHELQTNQAWLLGTLLQFKAPNAKSSSSLDVARVVLGNRTLEINAEMQNLARVISKKLVLDEVQTYILVCRCLGDAQKLTDSDLVQKVTLKYFTERQCLLKCLRLLLLSHMAETSDSFVVEPIDQLVNYLIEGGLESKIFTTLENLLSTEQPWDLGLQSMNLWAEEMSTEVNLVMDIVFLLYYKPLCTCSFNHWKELFTTFQAKILSGSMVESLSVTDEATKLVEYIKHQAVLILLEILDLDKLLLMVFDDVPLSQDRYPFSIQELQQMDEVFGQLNVSELQEYAPLLLGWGTFGCLVSFLPIKNQTTLEVDHVTYIQQAHQGGAFSCFLDMVQHKGIQGSNIDGYKCVIKSVISSFCASYDITHQSDSAIIDMIVEILHSIYLGQEVLCVEFWDRESILDSPLRNLLYTLREGFPFQLKPLVKLLAGLTEGMWPAECVYNFLYKPSEITCISPCKRPVSLTNECQFTNAAALEVSGVPALLIPTGTVGCIVKELDDQTSVVLWKCKHSAIIILLLRLTGLCISEDSWTETHLIMDLIHNMLLSNKMLAEVILLLDNSEVCKEAKTDVRMEETTRINPLAVMCMVLDKLMDLPGRNATAALCMDILGIFAGCCPLKVMHELSNIQAKGSTDNVMDSGLLAKSLSSMYKDFERSDGTHPLVLSVLDLCASMVTKGIVTESLNNIVVHIVGNLFVNHMTWKYAEKYERWKITTKVFEVGQLVLSDSRPIMLQLKARVLEVIMVDGAFHSALLRILSTTENDLRGLYFSRFADLKEIEWFEKALCSGLTLLNQALSMSLSSTQDTKSNSPLEHAVMHHTDGTLPFILCIASLTGLFQNQAMQVASIKMLTTLCLVATKARPHPINILSYIQGLEQKHAIRRTFRRLLSKEMAELNLELYTLSVDFIVTTTRCQVSFVEMLLCPLNMGARIPSSNKLIAQGEIDNQDENSASIYMSIKEILSDGRSLLKSDPQILCPILCLVKSVWDIGLEFPGILEVFRQHDDFWKLITLSVSNSLCILEDKICDESIGRSYLYQCQTFALEIMASEFFLQKYKKVQRPVLQQGSDDNIKVLQTISGIRKNGNELSLLQLTDIINPTKLRFSICGCSYDKKVVKGARAEMRALIVSLLLKILTNDELGISAPLLRFLQQALKMVVDHAAFQGILSNYLSHGYGSGKELQILVMNDLYFHLQGELEAGRHIPAGAFEDLVSLLDTMDIAPFVFNSKERQHEKLQPLDAHCFLYDTTQLRQHLGLEWWSQTPLHIVQTAENTLDFLQQANSMACLGTCQVFTLDALSSVLSLFITTKEEVGVGIKVKWTASFITELCCCISETMNYLTPDSDPTRYVESLISAQSRLLAILMNWFDICMKAEYVEEEVENICPKVMSTFLVTMRTMWNRYIFSESPEMQLVRSVLGACLSCLNLMQTKFHGLTLWEVETKESVQKNGAVSDVEMFSMEFLPMLCALIEDKHCVNLTIAVICVLIRNFVTPQIWLQVFEAHSTIRYSLALLHTADTDTSYEVLNFLLCLCHFRKGTEMLLSAGFFSHILNFMKNLKEDVSGIGDIKEPFQVQKTRTRKRDLWSVSAGIVSAIVKNLGDDNRNTAVENAFVFFETYKEFLISALESVYFSDTDGIKRAKFGHRETTISSLQGTQQAIHLLAALVRHRSLWCNAMIRSKIDVRHNCIHLLAFVAREGLVRNLTGSTTTFLHCIPLDKLEVVAQAKDSLIGSTSGWFMLAAKAVSSTKSISLGLECQGLLTTRSSMVSTEFSDSIALHVYKIALLLLQFLLKEAQYAVAVIDEGNTCSSRVIPEFPAPEILYGLQDQAISVITDICSRSKTERGSSEQHQACILMINILDRALFLEICVSRICAMGPSSARSDDFMREFKRLIEVVEGNEIFTAHIKTLKGIAVLAYPALT